MRRIAVGFIVALALLGVIAAVAWHGMTSEGPSTAETTVVVPRGAGLSEIARTLTEAGVVRKPLLLILAARMQGANRQLRAGEYAFPAGVSPMEAVEILRSGQTVVRRLTIPEGLTSAQVIRLLEAEETLSGDPPPVPPEGTLLPETYHFSRGDSRAELVERMQSKMRETLAELWEKRSPDAPVRTPVGPDSLPSIIEKETAVAQERPRVAGVFANRLEQGMRLQSDPTIVYALTEGDGVLGRALTRRDTRFESPYNTYVADGLPPGPIANPGRASLEAALNPEDHDYLYFVADGTGGHAFARDLREHNRNVAKWRAVQRAQDRQEDPDADQ